MIPRATLRLQFHRGFTFADAERLVPYFARLGVSHVYASPIAISRAGSMHGYDVVDPTRVNPELGGEPALRSLAAALATAGLGLVIDIVPNHMAADTENRWWVDVLRHGQRSPFARYFDIDWEVDDPDLRGKVLLPILGASLEEALAAGEISIAREGLRYFETTLPLADETGGELRAVLARQHYRLASWRSAGDRINWRRFFDVNELVSLRMDEPAAFDAVHALPLRLYAEGLVEGLRVDHVDGLADPAGYCRLLRQRLDTIAAERGRPRAWLVVEKILLRGESLSADWACDGTTGYDFMNEVSALQHDAAGEACLGEAWARLSGRPASFAPEEQAARREIVARSFAAQLDAVAAGLAGGELGRATLRRVLTELLVHFPVYRTYSVAGVLPASDHRTIEQAAEGARKTCLATDRWAIDPVVRLFTDGTGDDRAVARFQQLSAPVAAKAVEDTGFYRYGRLLSRNDVGFDVETFASDAAAFHARIAARASRHPQALLATATHDHKRGEDTRARLAVLSEIAGDWAALQARWVEALRPLRTGKAPGNGDIEMLLQTIVGAWPLDLSLDDAAGRAAFAGRLVVWQQKALREAKLASDWAAVDEGYESAARRLTEALVGEAALPDLLREIVALVARIAAPGAVNGLAQCLLRLTVPGVPDLYQGAELWDFSLVDPDNRRPVDFAARAAGLSTEPLAALAARWRDGAVKQALIHRALDLRRRCPDLFAHGTYQPLRIEGPLADSAVAFARRHEEDWLLVVAPRLPTRLLAGDGIAVSGGAWKESAIVLDEAPAREVFDALGDRRLKLDRGTVPLGQLCAPLPFALFSTIRR